MQALEPDYCFQTPAMPLTSCVTTGKFFMAEPLGKSLSSMSSWVKDNFIWKNISIFGLRSIFFCLIIHPLLNSLVLKNKTNVTRVKYYQ